MSQNEPYTQQTHLENFRDVQNEKAPFYAVYVNDHEHQHVYDFSHLLTAVIKNSAGDVANNSKIPDVYVRDSNIINVRDTGKIFLLPTHRIEVKDAKSAKLVRVNPEAETETFQNARGYFQLERFEANELHKVYPAIEQVMNHAVVGSKAIEFEKFCQFLCLVAKILFCKSCNLPENTPEEKKIRADILSNVLYLQKSAMRLSSKVRGWFGIQCKKDPTNRNLTTFNLTKKIHKLKVNPSQGIPEGSLQGVTKKTKSPRLFSRQYSLRHSTGSCVI